MLIDILRMPPVFGIPLDRRMLVHAGNNSPPNMGIPAIHWPTVPLYHENVIVGSMIDRVPQSVYKAIHISHDERWVFETVFAMENGACICLYTKIISALGITVAVSLNTVAYYQTHPTDVLPIPHFVARPSIGGIDHYETALSINIGADGIVPLVLGERELWQYFSIIIEARQHGHGDNQLGIGYKPIYEHEPSLFHALINGEFYRSPFQEIRVYHPSIHVPHDRWFNYEELKFMIEARGFLYQVNHPAFDSLVQSIIHMIPSKLNVTCLMSHALDDIRDLWLTRELKNPYHHMFYGLTVDHADLQVQLATIFHLSAMTYCRLFNIDFNIFVERKLYKCSMDQSSVTITKNLYDEVSITFHDILNDRYVCFYTSFPALTLTTLAVGRY